MATPRIISRHSSKEEYEALFSECSVGDVFKFDRTIAYETILVRLEKHKPDTVAAYTVQYVPPGHELYTFYKENTIVFTDIVLVP